MKGPSIVERLAGDARYAVRVLRGSPGFTLTAIVTLGLTIGANTAVFSVVDALLIRPLPYPAPERLALVATNYRSATREVSSNQTAQDGRIWEAIRDHARTVDAAVYSTMAGGVNLVTPSGAAFVPQQRVGAGYFRVLGVPPIAGREFTHEEDVPNGPAVAILSYDLWQRTLQGSGAAVGATIRLRGEPHTIVGVMPAGFDPGQPVDVWTPLQPSTRGEGEGSNYGLLARLKPGVAWPRANAEVAALGARASQQTPPGDWTVTHFLMPLKSGITQDIRPSVLVLWGAVGLVLLIACANLAGLMLARSGRRQREIATRLAIGGGRRAVTQQLFTESVLLAAAGGVLGLALGSLALRMLSGVAQTQFGIHEPLVIDGRVLAITGGLSLFTAILFGLAPAYHATRIDVHRALVEAGTRGATGGSRWPRRVLVIAEVAVGVVLLVSAGLLVRTFVHFRELEPGFDARGVTTATVSLQDARYREAAGVTRLFEDSLERIRQTPGVEAAAVSLGLPYQRILNIGFRRPGDEQGSITNLSYITADYFRALRIPVFRGRVFDDRETAGSPLVVVVNEAFARTYFSEDDPIGRRIAVSGGEREIVGVVGDVQLVPGWGNLGPIAAMPLVYLPVSQTNDAFLQLVHTWFSPAYVVRASGPVQGIETGISRAVAAVDPFLPVASIQSLEDVRALSMAHARFMAGLLVTLGGIAALLAAIGIHGLIAASVNDRTREMGIRLALGASAAQAVRSTALTGVGLAGAGVVLGTVLAYWAATLLRTLLSGVTPTDPRTFAAAAVMLLVVAALASTGPALRILRLDPAETLRTE
jgi:predicted permease